MTSRADNFCPEPTICFAITSRHPLDPYWWNAISGQDLSLSQRQPSGMCDNFAGGQACKIRCRARAIPPDISVNAFGLAAIALMSSKIDQFRGLVTRADRDSTMHTRTMTYVSLPANNLPSISSILN